MDPCNCPATDKTESLFLPMEIMVELFYWLDAQNLLKFKSVCKQWRALIEDPHFVEGHASRAPFLRYNEDEVDKTGQQIQFVSTYNGLVLERIIGNASSGCKYRVRNPTTRLVFDLPQLYEHPCEHLTTMILCYVPSSGCYKVLSFCCSKDKSSILRIDVLTLGSVDEPPWRFVDSTLLRNFYQRYRSLLIRCFKGVLHFYPKSGFGSNDLELVSLDMDKESFTSTTLPRSFFSGSQTTIRTIVYKDHRNLCYLSLAEIVNDELRLLVLEDYKKDKWAEEMIVIPLTFLKENSNMKIAQPYCASPWYVWFIMNAETKRYNIQYNIKSHAMIIKELSQPKKKEAFITKKTLVTFSGMRLEEN